MINVIDILEKKINQLRNESEKLNFILYKNEEKTCLILKTIKSFNNFEVFQINKVDSEYKLKFPQIGEVWALVKFLNNAHEDNLSKLKYQFSFETEEALIEFIENGIVENLNKI